MKILIITYYWPPAASVGVRRWLKFSEQLLAHGIEPVVFCPENASYPIVDNSDDHTKRLPDLQVNKVPIFEWRDLYQKIIPKKSKSNPIEKNKIDSVFHLDKKRLGLRRKLSLWIRANIILPDARAAWIGPCSARINAYLKTNSVDLIISTGPPHTCHMIGLRVKSKNPDIPWIADFRDPWTGGAYFSLLPMTGFGLKRHQKMESQVLKACDCALTVSWSWAKQLSDLGAKMTRVVTNGYDAPDFPNAAFQSDKYIISHIGTLFKDRSSTLFWNSLSTYLHARPEFKQHFQLQLIGQVGSDVIEQIESIGLSDVVEIIGVVDHRNALELMQNSNSLLLLVNKANDYQGRIPAKAFEYLGAKKPILLIGPKSGDIHQVIKRNVTFIDYNEVDEAIYHQKLDLIFKSTFTYSHEDETFERKKLTQRLIDVFDEVLKQQSS